MKIAVYPGSFDPVTNGHLDVIERACELFQKVIVAVIRNPEKQSLYTLSERVKLLRDALQNNKKVVVDSFDGLLVKYAQRKRAGVIVRGLRAVSDFDYEFQMALTNRKLAPKIETIFFMTDAKYSYLSSSLVKQIASLGGDVSSLAPKAVMSVFKKRGRR